MVGYDCFGAYVRNGMVYIKQKLLLWKGAFSLSVFFFTVLVSNRIYIFYFEDFLCSVFSSFFFHCVCECQNDEKIVENLHATTTTNSKSRIIVLFWYVPLFIFYFLPFISFGELFCSFAFIVFSVSSSISFFFSFLVFGSLL